MSGSDPGQEPACPAACSLAAPATLVVRSRFRTLVLCSCWLLVARQESWGGSRVFLRWSGAQGKDFSTPLTSQCGRALGWGGSAGPNFTFEEHQICPLDCREPGSYCSKYLLHCEPCQVSCLHGQGLATLLLQGQSFPLHQLPVGPHRCCIFTCQIST